MSRLIDVLIALPLAILSLPLVLLLALVVLVADGPPVFHRDPRLGRGGEPFGLLKIRSMKRAAGAAVTAADDPRLLPWGRFLRRFRLDELPQLWQVVLGRLALVGPRPESPRLVLADDPRDAALLACRPGLVDPAVLASLGEEVELAGRVDPEDWYRRHMRPRKLELSLAWMKGRSLGGDLRILLRAVTAVVAGRSGP